MKTGKIVKNLMLNENLKKYRHCRALTSFPSEEITKYEIHSS